MRGRTVSSNHKKLVQYHLARLKDRRPEARLAAISELTELGDRDALPALQALFETDPDISVRRAAQHAGRLIFLRTRKSGEDE